MKLYLFLFIITIALLSGCAGQRLPEGGPRDTTPPEIVSVYPAPNTVNYTENKIVLEFSEYVDRLSVQQSVFISPAISNVTFDWSGTEVEIDFNETLRKNTTYVVTIGTDVVDIREKNRMADAFSLSFATGDKIDNGTIRGKVYDEKPDGVMIFSYRLNDINADTLNPMKQKPDYITQTGKSGFFNLTNLAAGTYRLFAIRDQYKNLLYDPETDEAGTTDDITVSETDSLKTGIKFIIAKEDTTPPRLVSAQASDNRHLDVTFSEPLDYSSVNDSSFSIRDTLLTPLLSVKDFFFKYRDFTKGTMITDVQKDQQLYLLQVEGVKDQNGFIISPLAYQKTFTGSSIQDTIPPGLAYFSAKDTTATVFAGDSITVSFTDAILSPLTDSALSIMRLSDSAKIASTIVKENSSLFYVKPNSPFQVGKQYMVTLRWNDIKDYSMNFWKDSVSIFKFSITDPEKFGSIEGSFAGFGTSNPTVIEAENITVKNQKRRKTEISSFGKFKFSLLPEGMYVLKAFEDRNNNMIDDAGKIFPFQKGEQFTYYPDTIRVRARWPVDGVMIK